MTNPSTYTPPFNVNAGYSHLSGRQALVVQIAALSREDDAEVLASALRKRGYIAAVRTDEDDSLFHVQVGPYQRSVAMATRQRLIANGYNAIVK
jgi:cell division septation protein DedD